jgi:large subunit ribosomal protein L17
MRHLNKGRKLGRTASHRSALLASLVCNLIEEKRIRTTLEKAKEARRVAEKMITMARKGTLAARRQVLSILHQEKRVRQLFSDIVPQFEGRQGGYTRIIKVGFRRSDGAELALLEWVGIAAADKRRKKKEEPKEGEKKESAS